MSGKKTTYVSVADDELRRLRAAADRAAALDNSNSALRQMVASTDRILNDQRNRINSLNTTINNLNTALSNQAAAASKERQQLRAQLQSTIRSTNQALERMTREHEQQLTDMNDRFRADLAAHRSDTLRRIEANRQAMEDALNNAVSDLERQIGSVNDRVSAVARTVDAMATSDATLLELAREYAEVAALVDQETREGFRVELLCPGRLDQLTALMNQAQRDIDDCAKFPTNASVARSAARQAAEAALQLREDVIRAEQQWQLRYAAAQQELAAARAQREAASRIKYPDTEVQVDVDRWSNGGLAALDGRMDALEGRLSDAQDLTIDDLDGLRQSAQQVTQEVRETAEFAVFAFGSSQDRADVAQDVSDQLEELGIIAQSHGYQGDDRRGAHRLYLENPNTGFEMVVTQYPEVNEAGEFRNRLESDILNYGTNNEEEGDRLAAEVLGSLAGLGFAPAPVKTEAGFERRVSDRTDRRNMERWIYQEAPQVPAKPVTAVSGNQAAHN